MVIDLTKMRRAGAEKCTLAEMTDRANYGYSKVSVEFDNYDSADHVCTWLATNYGISAKLITPSSVNDSFGIRPPNPNYKVTFNI